MKVARFGRWLHEPDTVFAFKYAVASVLLWIPQIVPNSAYFVRPVRSARPEDSGALTTAPFADIQ